MPNPNSGFDCTDEQKKTCHAGAFLNRDGTGANVWTDFFDQDPPVRLPGEGYDAIWSQRVFLKALAPADTSFWLIVYNDCDGPGASPIKKQITVSF